MCVPMLVKEKSFLLLYDVFCQKLYLVPQPFDLLSLLVEHRLLVVNDTHDS